jgi:hypothetical protein
MVMAKWKKKTMGLDKHNTRAQKNQTDRRVKKKDGRTDGRLAALRIMHAYAFWYIFARSGDGHGHAPRANGQTSPL